MFARWSLVALDCPDPPALAAFYGALTGRAVAKTDPDWIELDGEPTIAFQLAPDHQPPSWPDPERPMQAHLDFDVTDLDDAEQHVLALGATRAGWQPGEHFRVFLDPAGHPFCLVREHRATEA